MRSWTKLALLVAAAVIVTQLMARRSRPAPGASAQAAPALALADVGGRRVDLAGLRGRVVAVNFWATWCGPCRAEMPELAEAWRAEHGRCFELLGVAEESAREDVVAAAREVPYPVLLDKDAVALDRWGVEGYPTTFLVDADGKIRRVFHGPVDRGELSEAVRPLLPASCPRS